MPGASASIVESTFRTIAESSTINTRIFLSSPVSIFISLSRRSCFSFPLSHPVTPPSTPRYLVPDPSSGLSFPRHLHHPVAVPHGPPTGVSHRRSSNQPEKAANRSARWRPLQSKHVSDP